MEKENTFSKRINVSSGRTIEKIAQFSRAIRVNNLVLQSGTTAIDVEGNIIGETVDSQIETIMETARQSMNAAGAVIADTFRARLYVKGKENIELAEKAFSRFFPERPPATTVFEICSLTRPGQLIEIELEAATNIPSPNLETSKQFLAKPQNSIRVDNKIFIDALSTKGHSIKENLLTIDNLLTKSLAQTESEKSDLVSLKFFSCEVKEIWREINLLKRLSGSGKPVVAFIGIPTPDTLIVEAELVVGAGMKSKSLPHPKFHPFSETLCVGDDIYISNIYPTDSTGNILYAKNWGGQRNVCTENLKTILSKNNATLDDVVFRRYLTHIDSPKPHYGDGPHWFSKTRPAALGCRISDHAIDETCLSLDAHAIRGAGEEIIWRSLQN